MGGPTMLQAILRRPTRSYAASQHRSPWADHEDEDEYNDYRERERQRPPSRYTAHVDHGVLLGYTEMDNPRYATAGPSRKESKRRDNAAMAAAQPSMGTQFPKPVRKVKSNVVIRDDYIVRVQEDDLVETTRTGTVKKKKKKKTRVVEEYSSDEESSVVTAPTRTETVRKVKRPTTPHMVETRPMPASEPTMKRSSMAPQPSSARVKPKKASAQAVPATQPAPTVAAPKSSARHKLIVDSNPPDTIVAPPLTPPTSDKSSSERPPVNTESSPPPPRPIKAAKRRSKAQPKEAEQEIEDEDIFYTPDTTMAINSARSTIVEPPTSANAKSKRGAPQMTFQPPTPAAAEELHESPFHSEQSSSVSSSLHPNDIPASHPVAHHLTQTRSQEFEYAYEDEDHDSAAGDMGSDEEVSERRSNVPVVDSSSGRRSKNGSPSRSSPVKNGSRTPSTGRSGSSSQGDRRPVSRQSTARGDAQHPDDRTLPRRNSFTRSEASFGGKSARESVRSGGGGWAAASRSGATTPVAMFMPSGASDGFAEFTQPPPRQSKFTPLPPASQPQTFDKFVRGIQDPPPEDEVPESEEETSEEEDFMPRPSQSYAAQQEEFRLQERPMPAPVPAPRSLYSEYSQEDRFEAAMRQRSVNIAAAAAAYLAEPSPPPSPQRHDETYEQLIGSQPPRRQNGNIESPPILAPRLPSIQPPIIQRQTSASKIKPSTLPIQPEADHINEDYVRPVSPEEEYSPTDGYPLSPPAEQLGRPLERVGFEAPSILNPDTITLLPVMTEEDSAKTYEPPVRPPSRRQGSVKRPASVLSGLSRRSKSDFGDYADEMDDVVPPLPVRRTKSAMGLRNDVSDWESSSAGEGVLMESNGLSPDSNGGYTNLILPAGAYTPGDPSKYSADLEARIMGMPHSNMAAITLATLPSKDTPMHLRSQNPPVDFTSYVRPPLKAGSGQLLIQIYATAVDEVDVKALDEKTRADVHRWIPGRSFVGRCLNVGAEEKDIVRGELIVGLVDVKKSGALSEYMMVDRRRLARAPYPTMLTLEQLSLLPLQGIPAIRSIRTSLVRNSRALLMDAHTGVAALLCQEMSRGGVNVTALISGGDDHHEVQTACMSNGARGVLTGSPAAVMLGQDEGGWDFVLDTKGGQRVYDAAKRILKNGARLVTTVKYDPTNPTSPIHSRSSGFKALRTAFASRRKDSKFIVFEYLAPGGTGEPEVDGSGLDVRDVLEEAAMTTFRPVVPAVMPLERGVEAFKPRKGPGVAVVRLVN